MKSSFKDFLFKDLEVKDASNKYYTCNRCNGDCSRLVIRVADSHLIKTPYGYAFILDYNHVLFLKEWAVNKNWFGCEILLDKQYFNPKEWGEHIEFECNEEALEWEYFVKIAQEQANEKVKWAK